MSYRCALVRRCYGGNLDGLGYRLRYSKSEVFLSSTFPVFTSLNFFAWQSATVTCYHIPHQILAEGYKVGFFLLTFFWLCNERSSLIKDWAWASIKDVSSFFPIFWHPQPQCRNVFPLLSVSKFQGHFDPSPSKLPTSFMDGLLHKIRQNSGVDHNFSTIRDHP